MIEILAAEEDFDGGVIAKVGEEFYFVDLDSARQNSGYFGRTGRSSFVIHR